MPLQCGSYGLGLRGGQLQNQAMMTKKKAVHITGLPAPTTNRITGLSLRLIMSTSLRPMKLRHNLKSQWTPAS
jgi:hypothetical protein